MDVFRFAAIEAVKVEAIRARDVFNGWHFSHFKIKTAGYLILRYFASF